MCMHMSPKATSLKSHKVMADTELITIGRKVTHLPSLFGVAVAACLFSSYQGN